jgi:hypothetical protein
MKDNSVPGRSRGPRYRTPAAAKYLGIGKSTLEKMRCTGAGPVFERPTKRAVVYSEEALEVYLAQRRARSTSEGSNLSPGPGPRQRKHNPKPDPGGNDDKSKPVDQQGKSTGTCERSDDAGAK